MKLNIRTVVVLSLVLLIVPEVLVAQTPLTPNTLELDDSAARPKATIADVDLLVGHWQGDFLGATAEEIWLPAVGNSMLGAFRLFDGDRVLFYEVMILVEEEESVTLKLKHFHADLKGWEEKDEMVDFPFVKADENSIWFEGLTFQKQADGSLKGYIALGQEGGGAEEESFVYRSVEAKQ